MQKLKVSYGEFDMPDGATTRILIQHAYLSKVAELAPEVWNDLYEATKQIFSELKAEYPKEYFNRDIDRFGLPPMTRERTSPIYTRHPKLAELIDLIDGWAHKWSLATSDPDDLWVVKVALAHLEFWDSKGREGEYLALGFDGFGPIPATVKPPSGLPEYHPLFLTRAGYLDLIRKQAAKAISDHALLQKIEDSQKTVSINSIAVSALSYCEQVEAHFESAGFIRGDERTKLAQHLDWAVRVRVKGESQTRIAEQTHFTDSGVTFQAVSKAINPLLRIIGLK